MLSLATYQTWQSYSLDNVSIHFSGHDTGTESERAIKFHYCGIFHGWPKLRYDVCTRRYYRFWSCTWQNLHLPDASSDEQQSQPSESSRATRLILYCNEPNCWRVATCQWNVWREFCHRESSEWWQWHFFSQSGCKFVMSENSVCVLAFVSLKYEVWCKTIRCKCNLTSCSIFDSHEKYVK